jgi:predicted signal transduction protein with EAL and GGDEF domain
MKSIRRDTAKAKRFVIRHRVNLQDLLLIIAAVLATAYLLFEIDLFVVDAEQSAKHAIEAHEWPLLGAVLCLGLFVFAWRRYNDQKREMRRRIAAEQHVRELAFQDPLTGLPNRRQFTEAMKAAIAAPPDRAACTRF